MNVYYAMPMPPLILTAPPIPSYECQYMNDHYAELHERRRARPRAAFHLSRAPQLCASSRCTGAVHEGTT